MVHASTGRVPPAIEGCLDACRRCLALIEAVAAAPPDAARRTYAAIGAHLRHCVDHLDCLFQGLDSGIVDYDARERDVACEIDPRRMQQRLQGAQHRLRGLDLGSTGKRLRVRQSAARGAAPVTVDSNLERELVFLSGHTIHHVAIMALLVRGQGIGLPAGVDMAFSTAAHLSAAPTGV